MEEIEEMRAQIECLRKEIVELRSLLESKNTQVRHAEEENRKLRHHNTHLQGKVDAYEYCIGCCP